MKSVSNTKDYMQITIHQPEHLPWLGFFHKIQNVDLFVVLDDVQFRKDYFQNRNRIRTRHGIEWITIPIKHKNSRQLIHDISISYDHDWVSKYLNKIVDAYATSKYFSKYFSGIETILRKKTLSLADLNIQLIRFMCESIGIKTRMIKSSELSLPPSNGPTRVNLDICLAVGAHEYLSGVSGRSYLDETLFKSAGVRVEFQQFYHPIYEQGYDSFEPCMSIIDLLFNYGQNSLSIINGENVSCLQHQIL